MKYLGYAILALVFLGIGLATYFSPFIREPDISGLGFAHREALRAGIAGLVATAGVALAGYLLVRYSGKKGGSPEDSGE
jgi:Na+-transporting methylmalonyl-CoA/oxaloacetate decarboxylase beta subunit